MENHYLDMVYVRLRPITCASKVIDIFFFFDRKRSSRFVGYDKTNIKLLIFGIKVLSLLVMFNIAPQFLFSHFNLSTFKNKLIS